jgi:hypothetical protein
VNAAWNNVFQVTCFGRNRNRPAVANYAPIPVACCDPCPQPCPQQVCTTRYVQRCYYEPVTVTETRTYYEPVTTYQTRYYWEPVCSYQYSCYYDPCTCTYQQRAVPVQSYRLRSQCCPVQSWAQRTCQVPVTTYRAAFRWEPVTTCCTTYGPPPCSTPAPAVGTPGVGERLAPQPGVGESRDGGTSSNGSSNRQFLPPQGGLSRFDDSRPRILPPQPATPTPANRPAPPPAVRLDRIVALPDHNLQGQVVRADNLPQGGARLVLVSAEREDTRHFVTADADGRFRATLAKGKWLVYVNGLDGKPVLDRKIDVGGEPQQLRLVSR